MDKHTLTKITETIDAQARCLVGTLCKRVEILENQSLLTEHLYKALAKELVYESSRNLKKLIEVQLTVGTMEFKARKEN